MQDFKVLVVTFRKRLAGIRAGRRVWRCRIEVGDRLTVDIMGWDGFERLQIESGFVEIVLMCMGLV